MRSTIFILLIGLFYIQSAAAQIRTDTSSVIKVYIIKHGWHTGIAFNKKQAAPHLAQLSNIFINAKYLEISWGDKDFFTSEKGTVWKALKAAFIPTESVILVSAYTKNIYLYYNIEHIQELRLTHESFTLLMSYFKNSIAKHLESERPIEVSKINDMNRFYLSTEKYHAFKTCNVWTARALKKSGIKVAPIWAITSDNIMQQVKRAEKRTNVTVSSNQN